MPRMVKRKEKESFELTLFPASQKWETIHPKYTYLIYTTMNKIIQLAKISCEISVEVNISAP